MPKASNDESRLTRLAVPAEPNAEKVAAHSFRRVDDFVVIGNEAGYHATLSAQDYPRYLAGGVSLEEPLGQELLNKAFLRDQLDFRGLAASFARRELLDAKGPGVHTIVVTLRCNFKCSYCHASVVGQDRLDRDMSIETARAVVDRAFESASPTLMLEFQGGEPLLNWPVVKFIARYARKKNEAHKKALHLGLISNFSLLDDEKIDALLALGVSFCTSLDGPADLHNKNRVFLGGNTHEQVVAGLKRLQDRRKADPKIDPPNAICTVTRFSLERPREIVDQAVELGLERVQLGPLDPVGFARKSWDAIGYTSAEFLAFYEKALDRILEHNRNGVRVYEKTAMILLVRLLSGEHWRFPNAEGLSRLAYDYNGDVYPGEDARLLANGGDEFFKLGNARERSLAELLEHPTVRAARLAASPSAQPMCFQCAYASACTVQPVYNHQTQGGVWGHMPTNGWCEKMMGLFDLLFRRMRDPKTRETLESWLEYKSR